MTKYIILDSGALINLTMNGLIEIFKELAEKFQGEFIITPSVKYETIDHPLNIKRFEWGAVRIKQLLEDETIKLAEDENLITQKELNKKTEEVMSTVNSSFTSAGEQIHLIERGEAECLALSLILTSRNIANAVVIDERTARMLCENPENLKKIMENKLHTSVNINKSNIKVLQKIKVIRTPELMYMAFKKAVIEKDKKKLEAILYALKFGGCSVSEKEVEAITNS
jgi:hypothetical protein